MDFDRVDAERKALEDRLATDDGVEVGNLKHFQNFLGIPEKRAAWHVALTDSNNFSLPFGAFTASMLVSAPDIRSIKIIDVPTDDEY